MLATFAILFKKVQSSNQPVATKKDAVKRIKIDLTVDGNQVSLHSKYLLFKFG